MFKVREVKRVSWSEFNKCVVAVYEEDGIDKYAACTEHLSIKCGDKVEIYGDEHVNYKGFGAMALKVV